VLKETDKIRGDVDRSTYIKRALEQYGHCLIHNGKWIKSFLEMVKEDAELNLKDKDVYKTQELRDTIKMAEHILDIIAKLGDKKTITLTYQLAWDLYWTLQSKRDGLIILSSEKRDFPYESDKDERKYWQDQLGIIDYYMQTLDIAPTRIDLDLPILTASERNERFGTVWHERGYERKEEEKATGEKLAEDKKDKKRVIRQRRILEKKVR
jgi:hypothetical protein